VATIVAGLGGSPGVQAQGDAQALQTLLLRNNCLACHLMDKRKYGPHFQEVATKYAGRAGAAATLAVKIRAGGSGVWGDDMMPPQPQVSEANAKAMAELILALKP
jgi:cytochrome c